MSSDRYHVPPTLTDDNMEDKSYSLSGKIMVSVILILFFLVVLLISLHLYVRTRLLRARRRRLSRRLTGLNEAHRRQSQIVFFVNGNPTTVTDPGNRGLESSVLSSLPVFVYSAKTHPEPLDCAVCLSEIEENEKARYLPKCNHSFHIECIDMWFHSHSTCPLCRTPVEPITEPENIGFRFSDSERTGNESSATSSGFCVACRQEEGTSSMTSLGSRRRGLDMRIEVPMRNQMEDELTLSPIGRGSRSPGTRLLSMRMKRLLSFGGRKTPRNEWSTTPSGAGTSFSVGEVDLEKGPSELTPKQSL